MRLYTRNSFLFLYFIVLTSFLSLSAQFAGTSGTVTGTVADPSGAVIQGASVVIQNPVSGVTRTTTTAADGTWQFTNLAFNPYQVIVTRDGFKRQTQRFEVRSPVPVIIKTSLSISSAGTEVTVEAGGDLVETDSVAHTDIDRATIDKLPLESSSSGLSSLLTLASPGVSADSNGLIHGLGDHAENAFYEDGQPITDQQSKVFSNQIPVSAIQSLEVITGAPPAEYGEKTSLVATITTRSGLGILHPRGEIVASYGTFGNTDVTASVALGTQRLGNFAAIDVIEDGRFLDPAEFKVMHAKGNIENFFDRVDAQVSKQDTVHANVEYTRSWFQTPNSYDNTNLTDQFGNTIPNTDQRSKIGTINFAPGFSHVVDDHSVLTGVFYVRRDKFNYYPSKNPLSDFGPIQSESISQDRDLTNAGTRLDYNYVRGINNIKAGGVYQQTLLNERFSLGIVNPTLNSPCVNASGVSVPGYNDPSQCAAAGLQPNPSFNPVLGCSDLTRSTPSAADGCGGNSTPYLFRGHTDVKLASLYAQDAITKGHFTANVGLRGDFYNGLSVARQAEPRAGVAYNFARTGTVLRASYARSLETPFNENLILSSRGCSSPVISGLVPCVPANFNPGFRNEFHVGFEQAFGQHLVVSADEIWKYTHDGYDFSVLGATPVTFPIEWHNSKIQGFDLRATVPQYRGFSAFAVMSSVSARFFPPQIGGLGTTQEGGSPFRIDHDEKFNQTTHLQYQVGHRGPFASFNWRYDSGMVAGSVPYAINSTTPVDLTFLTADEQQQAGLECGTDKATLTHALTTCAPSLYHSSLVSIPAPGTENDDHNPPRIAPRNVFDLAVGEDNLFKGDKRTFSARVTVINLANKYALYNFLSTFSGTHYLTPRAITGEFGYHF